MTRSRWVTCSVMTTVLSIAALVNRLIYPISRIRQELGYSHVTSMEVGLWELFEGYKQRLRHPAL